MTNSNINNTNKKIKRKYRSNFDKVDDENALEANITDQEKLEVKHYFKTSIGVTNIIAIVNLYYLYINFKICYFYSMKIFLVPCLISIFLVINPGSNMKYPINYLNIGSFTTVPLALIIEIACLIVNLRCLLYKTSRIFDITVKCDLMEYEIIFFIL